MYLAQFPTPPFCGLIYVQLLYVHKDGSILAGIYHFFSSSKSWHDWLLQVVFFCCETERVIYIQTSQGKFQSCGKKPFKNLFITLTKGCKSWPFLFILHARWIVSVIITINQTVDYMARATASVIWAQNTQDFQPNPSNGPSNVFAQHQNHNGQGPYKKTGSLVFLCK